MPCGIIQTDSNSFLFTYEKVLNVIYEKFDSEWMNSPISSLNVAQVESKHERKCVESILWSSVQDQISIDRI